MPSLLALPLTMPPPPSEPSPLVFETRRRRNDERDLKLAASQQTAEVLAAIPDVEHRRGAALAELDAVWGNLWSTIEAEEQLMGEHDVPVAKKKTPQSAPKPPEHISTEPAGATEPARRHPARPQPVPTVCRTLDSHCELSFGPCAPPGQLGRCPRLNPRGVGAVSEVGS